MIKQALCLQVLNKTKNAKLRKVILEHADPRDYKRSVRMRAQHPAMEHAIDVERQGAKTIKKNTNSTQNKSQTHRAKQYEVTSFLSTDCELSTDTCSKNVYSIGPRPHCGSIRPNYV